MKKVYIIFCILTITISGISQTNHKDKKAQMDALRVQFFTEELDLSEKESEAFWPLYYQFDKERKRLKKEIRAKKNQLTTTSTSDTELKTNLDELCSLEIQLAEKRKELALKCIPVLGVEKSALFVTLEDRLRKRVADMVKNRLK